MVYENTAETKLLFINTYLYTECVNSLVTRNSNVMGISFPYLSITKTEKINAKIANKHSWRLIVINSYYQL